MNEHEQLKEICDKIWYKIDDEIMEIWNWEEFIDTDWATYAHTLNSREIIFTQEFMDKFKNHCLKKDWQIFFYEWLMTNLDNPTQYLYNLIK